MNKKMKAMFLCALLCSEGTALAEAAAPANLRGAAAIVEDIHKIVPAKKEEAAEDPAADRDDSSFKPSKAVRTIHDQIDRLERLPAESSERVRAWVLVYVSLQQATTAAAASPANRDSRYEVSLLRDQTRRLLETLPASSTWPALATVLRQRYVLKPGMPADNFPMAALTLAGILTDDDAALQTLLATTMLPAAALDVGMLEYKRSEVRDRLTQRAGKPAMLAAFRQQFDKKTKLQAVWIPDLVSLAGRAQAESILREILPSDATITSVAGEETRKLAQSLAVSDVGQLRRAQWALVYGEACAPLYEAMLQRFPPPTADAGSYVRWSPMHWLIAWAIGRDTTKSPAYSQVQSDFINAKREYFRALIATGRIKDGVAVYLGLREGTNEYMLNQTLDDLDHAGHAQNLLDFVEAAIHQRDSDDLWRRYIELAPRLGHQDAMLERLRASLARAGSGSAASARFSTMLIDGLLAADQIDEAAGLLVARLDDAKYPRLARARWALKLGQIGRLTDRAEWRERGLTEVARSLSAIPAVSDVASSGPNAWSESYDRAELVKGYAAELAKLARYTEIETLLSSDLLALSQAAVNDQMLDASRLSDLATELIANYTAAGRPHDVLALLDQLSAWEARDLADLLEQSDDAHVPLGFHAAKALADTGQRAAAVRVLDAVIATFPGFDPAYALYLQQADPAQTLAMLDRQFARDPFEERPLIWKATALRDVGKMDQALTLARQAQAIDPSDGEEGSPDRMRVYAVLAELLDSTGDTATAAIYRNAVKSIRIGEEADELRKVGLHTRAVARYRDALALFADAYCVQSRLAVELNKQGRYADAEAHYRRAFELMPQSFGRLESHCFGCEKVFQGDKVQGIADQVFSELVRKTPEKPQVHYVLGYLRREQGRYAEAIQHQRDAVARDGDYLSAWKQLYQLDEFVQLEPGERDIAILRMLALDPLSRHVQPDLKKVQDVRGLYATVDAARLRIAKAPDHLYPLKASGAKVDAEKADPTMSYEPHLTRPQGIPMTPSQAIAGSAGMTPVRVWLDLDWQKL
ncbi:MAG: tetratricopeptide repeat protein [Tahibacter sp.]